MKIVPNDRVRRRGRPGDAAFHLRIDDSLSERAERLRSGIAGIGIQAVPVDRPTIDRGGVPVFRRPRGSSSRANVRVSPIEGASPTRPAAVCWSPIWITPRRKVPVVSTAAPQWITDPSAHKTPDKRPSRPTSRSSTEPARTVSPDVSASIRWIACRYSARSAWARGPRTAGPLLRFSSLKWMPAASAARPISPSSASTSRTRCPLPIPPIDGLQDISPIVSRRWVSNSVRAPTRAADRGSLAVRHALHRSPLRRNAQSLTLRPCYTRAAARFIAPIGCNRPSSNVLDHVWNSCLSII